jgi:hypothetical protein
MVERQAAEGMVELGTGIVYASVLGLPAPTSHVKGTKPVMSELPRRVEGMHRRECIPGDKGLTRQMS